jgi:hypothetical protein
VFDFLWQFVGDSPAALQAVSLLQFAFTIWMLVDAYQRGAEYYWFFIIFFVQPFVGPLLYFFLFKFRTLRLPFTQRAAYAPSPDRKLSLDALRYRVERAPTVANRLALAQRLMDKKQHADAIPLLEAILNVEPGYCQALHDLAECRLAAGKAELAIAPLEKLLERDRRWSNYLAWRTLMEVHLACHKPADALRACQELEKHMPTLENKCLLAEHLLDNGKKADAVKILDQGLEDHHFTPLGARLRNWRWARQARKLLEEAEKN